MIDISDYLSPTLYNGLLTTAIAILSVGLAWGIRPAIQYLLQRMGPTWSGVGATLFQMCVILGGMTLTVSAVGGNALLWMLIVSATFLVGLWVVRRKLNHERLARTAQRARLLTFAQSKRLSNAIGDKDAEGKAGTDAAAAFNVTVADTRAHHPNHADRLEIETTASLVPPQGVPVTQIEQPAEALPARRKLIQHAAAIPLTRRRKLGKRTVQGFR